jgi:hypothetical protein
MKRSRAPRLVTVLAGLALSSAARAQFTLVNDRPGAFATGVDVPANRLLFVAGFTPVTIPAAYDNGILHAGSYRAARDGRIGDLGPSPVVDNAPMSHATGAGYYPYWDELLLTFSETSGIYAADLGTMFVIQWDAQPSDGFSSGVPENGGDASIQVQIFPAGHDPAAQFVYRHMGTVTGQGATIGALTQGAVTLQWGFNSAGRIGDAVVVSVVAGADGGCCLPDGPCGLTSAASCASLAGIYRGDNSVCGGASCPTGACCRDIGCVVLTESQCSAQHGVYRGDGAACATASCPQPTAWEEQGDAPQLPGAAQVVTGIAGTPVLQIRGTLVGPFAETDMYQIQICDASAFSATTDDPLTRVANTQLFLFDSTGHGIEFEDDIDPFGNGGTINQEARITSLFVPGPGLYYLAVNGFNQKPRGADTGGHLWNITPLNLERRPDGPGAAEAIGDWDTGTTTNSGPYAIDLAGVCFIGRTCYANCDGSTTPPVLNISDFICFQSQFAAGDPRANCDGSTAAPILNIADFVCFQQQFAAGCP